MNPIPHTGEALAPAITKAASQQTYYTIRFFVDPGRVPAAFRAYAYFRWVDNILDDTPGPRYEKIAFINRQKALLEACYRGEMGNVFGHPNLCDEEGMLVDLVSGDPEPNSGLQTYLRNMMGVMAFDARRRGQLITQAELTEYSRLLATAVTEAMYYFIGHGDPSPRQEGRYLAVTAAHITHMLRDTSEDAEAGYYNIPREVLQARGISPCDVDSRAYREWVFSRVQLARRYFRAGQSYLARVKSLRCRLAGYAYAARFEWTLNAIEADHYLLRSTYAQRKSLAAGLWMGWSTLASMLFSR